MSEYDRTSDRRYDRIDLLEHLPARPDDLDLFRCGRLLILSSIVEEMKNPRPLDIERLAFYDFFSANPFLITTDLGEQRQLTIAGFDTRSLSYQSSGHRFTNRRQRLQFDLSRLVAYGLVTAEARTGRVTFHLTGAGQNFSAEFRSMYARAYRRSARLVVKRLNALSDRALHVHAREWLQARPFLIDLYDFEEEPGS